MDTPVPGLLPTKGLSLPTKIFLSFAAIIVAFGLTLGVALVRERQTLRDLSLVNGGLLPATLAVAKVRNTQELLVTTLESDPLRRLQWLALARQLRPASIRRTASSTRQAGELARLPEVAQALRDLSLEIDDIAEEAEAHEPDYRELVTALESGDEIEIDALLRPLIRRERALGERLYLVQDQIVDQIELIAREMEETERQMIWLLFLLTMGALVVAAGLTYYSWRALSPLSKLTAGVIAVGAGDLEQQVDIKSGDEIGTLAQEFNKMTAQLIEREKQLVRSERLAGIGKFVAKVTHDIRNALNTMGPRAELLQEDLETLLDEGDRKEPLNNLGAITDRLRYLEELTGEYLSFAKPAALTFEPSDLDDLLEDFFDRERSALIKNKVELHLELSYGLPRVAVDRVQISRVFSNLVRNAQEAMEGGGALSVKTRVVEGAVEVELKDSGGGMEPGVVDKIFDDFYTTKARGTGLGLANAQDIVVKHGGTIECRSSLGEGACFTIRLPASEAELSGGESGVERDTA